MIGFVLQSCSSGDTEAGALMFGSLYSILIKYQLHCQVSNAGTDVFCVCVCVCVCQRDHFNCFLIPADRGAVRGGEVRTILRARRWEGAPEGET